MAQGRTTTSKTTDNSVVVAEKQARALRLRRDGKSYEEIARIVGYADRGAAHKAVHTAIAEITKEPAEGAKRVEEERLDHLYSAALRIQRKARACGELEAEVKAIMAALKVRESYRKLAGYDAPTKTQDVSPYDGMSKDELKAKAAELAEKMAAAAKESE